MDIPSRVSCEVDREVEFCQADAAKVDNQMEFCSPNTKHKSHELVIWKASVGGWKRELAICPLSRNRGAGEVAVSKANEREKFVNVELSEANTAQISDEMEFFQSVVLSGLVGAAVEVSQESNSDQRQSQLELSKYDQRHEESELGIPKDGKVRSLRQRRSFRNAK